MSQTSDVSLVSAARAILGSRRLWLVIMVGAALLTIESVFSAGRLQVLSLVAETLVLGYQVCVSRAVVMGEAALPPLAGVKVVVRRGLSAAFVVAVAAVPVFLLAIAVFLFSSLSLTLPVLAGLLPLVVRAPRGGALWVLLVSMDVAAVALMITVAARYVAFDRLEEGFRYSGSLRAVRDHTRPWLQAIGWTLIGSITLVTLRLVVLGLLGLSTTRAKTTALDQLWHGGHGAGLALVAVDVVFAALSAPWVLISAHLLGQYAFAAFVGRQPSGLVESAG